MIALLLLLLILGIQLKTATLNLSWIICDIDMDIISHQGFSKFLCQGPPNIMIPLQGAPFSSIKAAVHLIIKTNVNISKNSMIL